MYILDGVWDYGEEFDTIRVHIIPKKLTHVVDIYIYIYLVISNPHNMIYISLPRAPLTPNLSSFPLN